MLSSTIPQPFISLFLMSSVHCFSVLFAKVSSVTANKRSIIAITPSKGCLRFDSKAPLPRIHVPRSFLYSRLLHLEHSKTPRLSHNSTLWHPFKAYKKAYRYRGILNTLPRLKPPAKGHDLCACTDYFR